MTSWGNVLATLVAGSDLEAGDAAWAMSEILSGAATDAQIAAFVVALRSKGESVGEVEALADTMYAHAAAVPFDGPALDIVGTGGDRAHTVNISTMASIVAAGAGATVVKHGNRAASSRCGTADVLEELGVRLDLTGRQVAEVAQRAGITFCFAPVFHPALRYAGPVRSQLGIGTTFNFLGPLANPARPSSQAVGVADARVAGLIAGVLARRGVSALVFHGDDGLDELTTTTTSQVWEVADGGVAGPVALDPQTLGFAPVAPEQLVGGDAQHNADVVRRLLAGEPGPVREVVLLNAAGALAVWEPDPSKPLLERMQDGVGRAAEAIDSGAAAETLRRWVAACQAVEGR